MSEHPGSPREKRRLGPVMGVPSVERPFDDPVERWRCLSRALSAHCREALWKTAAWAAIGKADPLLAHDALLHLPANAVDLHLLASYLGCCNRLDEAIDLLQQARRAGQCTLECTRLLADLLFRRGDCDEALALARRNDSTLSAEDRNAIEVAVASWQSA